MDGQVTAIERGEYNLALVGFLGHKTFTAGLRQSLYRSVTVRAAVHVAVGWVFLLVRLLITVAAGWWLASIGVDGWAVLLLFSVVIVYSVTPSWSDQKQRAVSVFWDTAMNDTGFLDYGLQTSLFTLRAHSSSEGGPPALTMPPITRR